METWRGWGVAALVLGLAVWGVGAAGGALDARHPDTGYQELLYLPSGTALKVVACGADAPLADLLYLKGLIYFSDNARALNKGDRAAGYRYLYKCFDAATDLNPRFSLAYVNGGLLVSGVGQTALARELFEKGMARLPNEWWLHLHMGAMAMVQMKDDNLALKHYELAAETPGVPDWAVGAAVGLRRRLLSEEGLTRAGMLDLEIERLQQVLADRGSNNEVRSYAADELPRLRTERWELRLTKALKAYREEHGRLPPPPPEKALFAEGMLPEESRVEFGAFPYIEGDTGVILPDGTAHSRIFVERHVQVATREVAAAAQRFLAREGRPAVGLEELVQARDLPALPVHPLSAGGYGYTFDPGRGALVEVPPES